jgi:hypothetical protein
VVTSGELIKLGPVPGSGRLSVLVRIPRAVPLRTGSLGCLEPARLAAAMDTLRAAASRETRFGGHRVEAVLPPGSTGLAVIATTRLPGWRCATDGGGWHSPSEVSGLLAVRLTRPTSRLSCTYRPPGLGLGLALGAAAAVCSGLLWAARARRTQLVPLTLGCRPGTTRPASGRFSTAGLAPGRHLVYVRGQDAAGNWGPTTAAWLVVP